LDSIEESRLVANVAFFVAGVKITSDWLCSNMERRIRTIDATSAAMKRFFSCGAENARFGTPTVQYRIEPESKLQCMLTKESANNEHDR
jgi:hypothetical protein